MKFSWSRAAYYSFRWAFIGAAVGLVAGFVGSLGGGRRDLPVVVSITFLYIFWFWTVRPGTVHKTTSR